MVSCRPESSYPRADPDQFRMRSTAGQLNIDELTLVRDITSNVQLHENNCSVFFFADLLYIMTS